MHSELEENHELFVPELPLRFDENDKLLIYQTDSLYRSRKLFRLAMIAPSVVVYCMARAIQRRSLWRMILWALPCFVSVNVMRNSRNFLALTVVKMHLKSDGETLVLNTALWEGTPRTHVVKIKDIEPHPEPATVFQSIADVMRDAFFVDHFPIVIKDTTYLLHKDS